MRFAVVALVRGSARVTENSIVASEIDRDISSLPVSFSIDIGSAVIDPSATYTIQATIVDGDNAWVTAEGVPVLTKGNPSKVAITLDYRPDVLKGAVTGQITGVGVQLSPTAYSMAVLVDPATGASLGIDVKTADQGLPVAFSIPYSLADIQPTADHVVTAEAGDSEMSWRKPPGSRSSPRATRRPRSRSSSPRSRRLRPARRRSRPLRRVPPPRPDPTERVAWI